MKISARKSNGLLFEKYEYRSVIFQPPPAHAHPEYQFLLSPNAVGGYMYRGGKALFAPHTLSVIHSGEKHAPNNDIPFKNAETFCLVYVSPQEMLDAARQIGWRKNELPYFKEFLISDPVLVEKFRRLFLAGDGAADALGVETAKLDFLAYLTENFSQNKNHVAHKAHPRCVKLAREYLDAHFRRAVSLEHLARVAGVSKYYLCREFRRVVGITPHGYQNQLRINHARWLILQKMSAAEIADELGFCDQSHFGRIFKRQIGTAPAQYSAADGG